MKPSLYLETSVIGYLAMRMSGILRIAANQQVTREWWDHRRDGYELFVSRYVIEECSQGDPVAAQERLVFLKGIPILEFGDAAEPLAKALISKVPFAREGGGGRLTHFSRCIERYRISSDVELQAHCQSCDPCKNRLCLP